MTMTAPIPTISRADTFAIRTHNVHGIDGMVERLAVAMLAWSRSREDRATLSHVEHARQRNLQLAAAQREFDALRLTQRIGL